MESDTTKGTMITLELTEDEAFWLQQFCVDAAFVWRENGRKSESGERPDIDPDACERLNLRAQLFAKRIREMRAAQ